jgi:hypothetical protein
MFLSCGLISNISNIIIITAGTVKKKNNIEAALPAAIYLCGRSDARCA